MKILLSICFAFALSLCSLFAQVPTWKIEPTSKITFSIKNAGVTVEGKFSVFTGEIHFDANKLESSHIEGSVDVQSIDTGIGARDKHLRNEDYFEVVKYPKISFKSNKIVKYEGNFVVEGILSIKDVKKDILLPLHITPNGDKANFKSTFTINRIDYHVGGSSLMMSNDVTFIVSVDAAK